MSEPLFMTGVVIAAVLFLLGASAAVWRIIVGPSRLDRLLGADVFLAITIAAIGGEMVVNRHTATLPVMLVLALVGVFGTISAARFLPNDDVDARGDGPGTYADPAPDPEAELDNGPEAELDSAATGTGTAASTERGIAR